MKKVIQASAVLGGSLLGVGSAFAAVPAQVTTALEAAAVDGAAVATLGLLVVIAIAAIKYLRGAK